MIQTSVNILVITEELVFVYNLVDVSRHDYLNTMEILQRSRKMKQDK